MSRIFFSLLVAMMLVVGPGIMGVEAQANNSTETTENVSEYPDRQPLDPMVDILAYEYDQEAGELEVTFRANLTTEVQVQPAVDRGSGTSSFAIHQQVLPRGVSTVSVPAEPISGEVAASVISERSIENGHGVWISTGPIEKDPFEPLGGAGGLFSGIVLSILTAGVAAGFVLWREESGVRDAK